MYRARKTRTSKSVNYVRHARIVMYECALESWENISQFTMISKLLRKVYRNTTYHIHRLGIYRFGNNVFVFGYILDHLVEGSALYFFPFQIRQWIGFEVEEDAALS